MSPFDSPVQFLAFQFTRIRPSSTYILFSASVPTSVKKTICCEGQGSKISKHRWCLLFVCGTEKYSNLAFEMASNCSSQCLYCDPWQEWECSEWHFFNHFPIMRFLFICFSFIQYFMCYITKVHTSKAIGSIFLFDVTSKCFSSCSRAYMVI